MGYPVRFTTAITHEGPWHVARCLEVDIASQGESLEQALDKLREALELYFEDKPLIELPMTPILAPVTVELPQP
jgi:predicted RNase H-like HicB family nuclease